MSGLDEFYGMDFTTFHVHVKVIVCIGNQDLYESCLNVIFIQCLKRLILWTGSISPLHLETLHGVFQFCGLKHCITANPCRNLAFPSNPANWHHPWMIPNKQSLLYSVVEHELIHAFNSFYSFWLHKLKSFMEQLMEKWTYWPFNKWF